MRQKSEPRGVISETIVEDIRRVPRKCISAEEKIRIVLDGLRGEDNIAELCQREPTQGAANDPAAERRTSLVARIFMAEQPDPYLVGIEMSKS